MLCYFLIESLLCSHFWKLEEDIEFLIYLRYLRLLQLPFQYQLFPTLILMMNPSVTLLIKPQIFLKWNCQPPLYHLLRLYICQKCTLKIPAPPLNYTIWLSVPGMCRKLGPNWGYPQFRVIFGQKLGWGLKIFKNCGQGWGWGCKIKENCGWCRGWGCHF